LVPEPYFVMYKQLALMLGARPVFYDTYPDWRIKAENIVPLISERTKAIVVGSPANPTGAVASAADFQALAAALRRARSAPAIVALADEIYSAFCYDQEFCSFADFYQPALVLGGFSKSHAMTGWRVGYAVGPEDLVQAMTKFQQFTFVCAPAPFQAAAVAALDVDMSAAIDAYRRKRDFIYEGLCRLGYRATRPGGAFYIFPEAPGGDSRVFVERCLAQELLVIPGDVFSERATHFRISYAASDETLRRGLEILGRLIERA
ncbi:MAG: pyridoxal phosphate-dependent aminotransferase, partial [Planctomycetota bacterium]|nr:pyridoxal phosphate-dependent aminotransferase [Planctomycetota bacterium]